jgi:hypothetical protein
MKSEKKPQYLSWMNTLLMTSNTETHMTHSGMLHKNNLSKQERFMVTCVCIGESNYYVGFMTGEKHIQ